MVQTIPDQAELDLSFAAGGSGRACVVSGWGDQEADWIWAIGPVSSLRLPLVPGEGDLACRITLIPFVHPPYLTHQRLIISANGVVCFRGVLVTRGDIEFAIPAGCRRGSASLDLEFQLPDCIAPVAIGAGSDPRALAVACRRLVITAVAPVPDSPVVQRAEPVYAGRAEPQFVDTTDVWAFGNGERHDRLCLIPALRGPAQIPMYDEASFDAEFVREHYRYPPTHEVCVYALRDSRLWGNGVVTVGDRFFLQQDCVPGYFGGYVKPGGHSFPEFWAGPMDGTVEVLRIDEPCAVVVHPNLVYGHFLLEGLAKLYLLGVLKDMGVRARVPLSDRTPGWVRAFVSFYADERDILPYALARQSVAPRSMIMPSMLHTDHNFHPAFNLMVADLLRRAGVAPAQREPGSGARIYLSRRQVHNGWHELTNEDEVEQVMEGFGFRIVHPQTLSLREQLELMASADIVAGEYSSALHNAMFCRPGTKVICLNCINWFQSAIGRLRRHKLAFVPTSDGRFLTWRQRGEGVHRFSIDIAQLTRVVRDVIADDSAVV